MVKRLIFVCMLLPFTHPVLGWGFYAHKQINQLAVFCLPPEMFGFFKQEIQFITEHAVDPDKRRYLMPEEGVKHFIDLDYYEKALPVDTVPFSYKDALVKFSKDTLFTYGIVPWNIQWKLRALSDAFLAGNKQTILKQAAELGHYIADAHVPLHTSSNYNGQKSNQQGIHAFFESRLPELFFSEYDFFVGSAQYIYHPLDFTWQCLSESYAALDSVFIFEQELRRHFPESKKFAYVQRGNGLVRTQSENYSMAYHRKLNGMVERRLRAAVLAVASFWYTAWVDAGQPNLCCLKNIPPEKANTEWFPEIFPEKMLGRQEN